MLHGQQIEQIGVAVTVCTCIRQVPSSNIGRDADYREDVFRDFPESLHENQGVSTSRRPQQPTFKSFQLNIHQSSHHSMLHCLREWRR